MPRTDRWYRLRTDEYREHKFGDKRAADSWFRVEERRRELAGAVRHAQRYLRQNAMRIDAKRAFIRTLKAAIWQAQRAQRGADDRHEYIGAIAELKDMLEREQNAVRRWQTLQSQYKRELPNLQRRYQIQAVRVEKAIIRLEKADAAGNLRHLRSAANEPKEKEIVYVQE